MTVCLDKRTKAVRKYQSNGEAGRVQLGGDIAGKRRIQIEALRKRLTELKEMYGEREYHFRIDHVDRLRPICIVILCR